MKINIAIYEPPSGADSDSVGAFEWRVDPIAAEQMFREFRSSVGTTYLFTDVEVPEDAESDEITNWVDFGYWEFANDRAKLEEYFKKPATKVFAR